MMSSIYSTFRSAFTLVARTTVCVLFLLTTLVACSESNDPSQGGAKSTPFFDLKTYFEQQATQLDSTRPSVEKRVSIGEEQEKKIVSDIDFEREFQIFRRSDINRPAWTDKYQVDSTFLNNALISVKYTAKDTSLNTRLLKISFQDGMVDSIRVFNRMQSAIASTEQRLLYCPGRNYRIESIQKTIGSDPKDVVIDVEFKN